jgi:hypothetical protein
MAAMTTVLTPTISQTAGTRSYTFAGNTYAHACKVLQKSVTPATQISVAEDRFRVIVGTEDDAGAPLAALNSVEVIVRRPVNGQTTDLNTCLATAQDIMASDEFAATISGQTPLA